MDYTRKSFNFTCKGMDLAHPIDIIGNGQFALLKNVRSFISGTLESRPGLSAKNSSSLPAAIHSIKRLNDPIASSLATPLQSYARILGAGTKLYSDNSAHDAFSEIDSGYSGNPLSFVPVRPEQSPEPWMYIGDSSRQRKVRVDGTNYQWGINRPTQPASVNLGTPNVKTIDDFEAGTFGSWSSGGAAAGALTNPDRVAAVVITYILYDSGSTGWASVNPASMAEIREGCFLTTSSNAETVAVDSIYKAVTTTTIGSISYDSGTLGLCTIQLTAPTSELRMNSMLRIGAAENVRVLSVTYGPDGIPSFRCSTTGTRSAGDAVAGLDSFRAYFNNVHAAADTLSTKMLQLAITGSGVTYVERTASFDLSTISNRPVAEDDVIHISLQVDDYNKVSELRILFDVDAATNDFTKNYYYYAIRQSDLAPVVAETVTQLQVDQRIAQRSEVDAAQERLTESRLRQQMRQDSGGGSFSEDPFEDVTQNPLLLDYYGLTPPSTQTATGASQWTELRIPVKLIDRLENRVGTDSSRSLKNVAKIRVSANVTAAITLKVDAWWIGGTYGPDSQGIPYYYRYRYRNKETGEVSPWSPPLRTPIYSNRQSIVLTPSYSSDTQVDKIDWIRIGGTRNEWRYVATTSNSGSFTDVYLDQDIAKNDVVTKKDFYDCVPFPVIDFPHSGTVDVKGTEVIWKSGDKFNTRWIRSSQIIINNVPYTLYTSPADDQHLSLDENAGTQSSASYYIPDAIAEGQTLPAVFGPYGGATIFGLLRGVLYWTNGNQPGLSNADNQLEVTGGSETLMNGLIYDGRPYLFSNLKMYQIATTQDSFVTQEVANSKGLISRWALCVDELIFFLGKDGIYVSEGGQPRLLSGDLGPLLPHEGISGIPVNGILAPDFTQTASLRLAYYDSALYFDFLDTGTNRRTLLLDSRVGGWFYDDYSPDILVHYGDEGENVHALLMGGANGKLYQASGASDDGVAISCEVRTPAFGSESLNDQWLFGDVALDINTGSNTLSVIAGYDNYSILKTAVTTSTGSRQSVIVNPLVSDGIKARNIALDFQWSSTSKVTLFGYAPNVFETTPDDTLFHQTLGVSFNLPGYVHFREWYLAYSADGEVTLSLSPDGGTADTYTIPSTGGEYRKYYFPVRARKGKLWSQNFTSDQPFNIYESTSEVRMKGWPPSGAYSSMSPFGTSGGE